jgi:hypothetical protein
MAGTYLGLPFDEELFFNEWQTAPNPRKDAILHSGAVAEDGDIASKTAGGSNIYTVPFYNILPTTAPVNYDGQTDITTEETSGDDLTGVVYGRAKGWTSRDFIKDFHRTDPMANIISQVAKYWDYQDVKMLTGIIEALFGCTPTDTDIATAWALHKTDISTTSTVADANKLGVAAMGDAAVKACGDNAPGLFSLAFMHSTVANNLAKLDLLEYRKYTDPMGIERQLPIADMNGYTVITDDSLIDTTGTNAKYTTYLLGNGVVRHANAPVDKPVEADRDAAKNGGMDILYTRKRQTYHVNGFSFLKPSGMAASPADDVLQASANWDLKFDPKTIAMARVISNG